MKGVDVQKNVIADDGSDEEEFKKEKYGNLREIENQNIRSMLATTEGKRYILRQLKRAFPLGGGSLCSSSQGTFYNLGKFESYLEILLDLREAYWDKVDGREVVGEILLGWFFDTEIEN